MNCDTEPDADRGLESTWLKEKTESYFDPYRITEEDSQYGCHEQEKKPILLRANYGQTDLVIGSLIVPSPSVNFTQRGDDLLVPNISNYNPKPYDRPHCNSQSPITHQETVTHQEMVDPISLNRGQPSPLPNKENCAPFTTFQTFYDPKTPTDTTTHNSGAKDFVTRFKMNNDYMNQLRKNRQDAMSKGQGVLLDRTSETNIINTCDLLDLTVTRNIRNREELVSKHNLDVRNEEFLRQHKGLATWEQGENNQFDFGKLTRGFEVGQGRDKGDGTSEDN